MEFRTEGGQRREPPRTVSGQQLEAAITAVLPRRTGHEISGAVRYGIIGSRGKRKQGRRALDLGSDPIHVEFFLKSLGHAIEQKKRDTITAKQAEQARLISAADRRNLASKSGKQAAKDSEILSRRKRNPD